MIAPSLLLILMPGACAQPAPIGMPLLNTDVADKFRLIGPDAATASLQVVPAQGQEFDKAVRVVTTKTSEKPHGVQAVAITGAMFKKGDKLVASFLARQTGAGDTAAAEFLVQRARENPAIFTRQKISAGREWKAFRIVFEAEQESGDGSALQATFRTGFSPTTFEFGGLQLTNYGADASLAELSAVASDPTPGTAIQSPPAATKELLNSEALPKKFRIIGKAADSASLKVVPVAGQGFVSAVQVVTTITAEKPFDIQVVASSGATWKKGDKLTATFWARSAGASDAAQTEFLVQRVRENPVVFARLPLSAGKQWKKYELPIEATEDAGNGANVQLTFRAGFAPMTLEFGGLQIAINGVPEAARTSGVLSAPRVVRAAYGLPGGGVSLLPEQAASAFTLRTGRGGEGTLQVVPAEHAPFSTVLQVDTTRKPEYSGGVEIKARSIQPIEAGDVMHLRFFLRGTRLQRASYVVQVTAGVGLAPPARPQRSLQTSVSTTAEWKQFDLPMIAAVSYPAGQGELSLQCGFDPQTVEIGGVEWINYGKQVRAAQLPFTDFSYEGRDEKAAWRAEAAKRIEQARKAPLVVQVRDAKGKAVAGANVSVRMKRHSFVFGSAAEDKVISGKNSSGPDAERYRREFSPLFNGSTAGLLSWSWWENPGMRAGALKTVDWLRANGITHIEGAHGVWGRWDRSGNGLMERYQSLAANDPAAAKAMLSTAITDHLREKIGAMRGKITQWNVVNEAYTQRDLQKILGDEAMVDWFKASREADPKASLIINEYAILDTRPASPGHRDYLETTAKMLLKKGAPLDGIGFQGHMFPPFTSPVEVKSLLDRYAALGKPLYVTEMDINTLDEKLQADYTRDFLLMLFSHPSVKGITMWGFWDGAHWKNNAPLFRNDWSLKPSGAVFKDLVFNKWWTSADGKTTKDGKFVTRGFYGDYEITVTQGAKIRKSTARLTNGSQPIAIRLP